MGDGEVIHQPHTFTEIFDEVFPQYLVMGMSWEQFWEGEPSLVRAYRKADSIRRRRMNEELWLSGMYTAEALASTVGNMFSKSNKHKYPAEPFAITADEIAERRERENRAKIEKIKAAFTARALSVNTRMGAKNND